MKRKAHGGQSSRVSTAKGLGGLKARGGFAATTGACLGRWLAGSPRAWTKHHQREGNPSMNILVIAQESGNHELADLVRQIPGHLVSLASSAEQAIGFIQSSHPGLILLDLRVPRRAGLSLVRRLSQNPRSRNIPALVVTGSPAFLNSKDFLSAGYEACFLGPFQSRTLTEQLMQTVAQAEPPRRSEMTF